MRALTIQTEALEKTDQTQLAGEFAENVKGYLNLQEKRADYHGGLAIARKGVCKIESIFGPFHPSLVDILQTQSVLLSRIGDLFLVCHPIV